MITQQKLYQDGDKICLRNTINVKPYIDAARQVNEIDNGGWFGDKNERMQLMGYIPPELWTVDPWLISARNAQREGDMLHYQHYIKKFFDVWAQFKVNHKRTTWNGYSAVLL